MKTNRRITKSLVASALALGLVASANTAMAGASESSIASAIWSNGTDAIIAALEEGEKMICGFTCNERVIPLLGHDDYAVREVAAWWIAKRPAQLRMVTSSSLADLQSGSSIEVRNAADFLGHVQSGTSIPALADAYARSGLDAEARLAITRALGNLGLAAANPTLEAAMGDSSAEVRLTALTAWKDIRHQQGSPAAVSLLSDSDSRVRSLAAAIAGTYRVADARTALESLLNDPDPYVARNAAYALGQIGDKASYQALLDATNHESGLVRRFAQFALTQLR